MLCTGMLSCWLLPVGDALYALSLKQQYATQVGKPQQNHVGAAWLHGSLSPLNPHEAVSSCYRHVVHLTIVLVITSVMVNSMNQACLLSQIWQQLPSGRAGVHNLAVQCSLSY